MGHPFCREKKWNQFLYGKRFDFELNIDLFSAMKTFHRDKDNFRFVDILILINRYRVFNFAIY